MPSLPTANAFPLVLERYRNLLIRGLLDRFGPAGIRSVAELRVNDDLTSIDLAARSAWAPDRHDELAWAITGYMSPLWSPETAGSYPGWHPSFAMTLNDTLRLTPWATMRRVCDGDADRAEWADAVGVEPVLRPLRAV